jgi:hypothetical protein
MRYRVTFELDATNNAATWDWPSLLDSVDGNGDCIDWTSFTVSEDAGWQELYVPEIHRKLP